MDQTILLSNKWHYQDVFSELFYFPLFLCKNRQNETAQVLLDEVTFWRYLNECFSSPMLPCPSIFKV